MTTPGSNLLNQALSIIAAQAIVYLAYVSRSETDFGTLVPVYASPVTIRGSIQAVPRALMELLGLDFQRNYVNIFVPNTIIDIARDVSSDQFQFGGSTFQALSLTKWRSIDGWNQVLCVEVPSA